MRPAREISLRIAENNIASAMAHIRGRNLDPLNHPEQEKIYVALGDALGWVQELIAEMEGKT